MTSVVVEVPLTNEEKKEQAVDFLSKGTISGLVTDFSSRLKELDQEEYGFVEMINGVEVLGAFSDFIESPDKENFMNCLRTLYQEEIIHERDFRKTQEAFEIEDVLREMLRTDKHAYLKTNFWINKTIKAWQEQINGQKDVIQDATSSGESVSNKKFAYLQTKKENAEALSFGIAALSIFQGQLQNMPNYEPVEEANLITAAKS